jgi:hypothetical protein
MRALSGQEILHLWEIGVGQYPLERALTILAAAFPEASPEELATLSIGERDARLLSVRERTFGSGINGYAECSQCQERLEFTLPVAAIRVADSPEGLAHELSVEDFELRFRLPDSRDLAVMVGCADLAEAQQLLLERSVLEISRDGMPITSRELPPQVITRLAARMAECDPQAEVLLDLRCPACGHGWQALFDIAAFLWAELAAQAKRLLREVHALARAYGWREADILTMSAWRRECYLQMTGV